MRSFRDDRLDKKKLMAEVHCHPLVPVLWRDILKLMAVVIRCIVDQDTNTSNLLFDLRNHGSQRCNVPHIAHPELRQMYTAVPQATDEFLCRLRRKVDERDTGARDRELFDH
jgi:hypothetical protein